MQLWLCLIVICASTVCRAIAQPSETVILNGPVKVATSADQGIFPRNWQSTRVNAQAELLRDNEISRSRRVLKAAFEKYPKHVLTKNLDAVYVLHRLKYSGISASGTNSRKQIYMANRGIRSGFTDAWVEGVFHAEFSSILKRNFARHFNENAWTAINRPGFEYGSSGVQAVKNGAARKTFDPKLHEVGFLFQYAQSTVENDFNAIAEQLFIGNPQFWAIVKQYDGIRRKTMLAIDFYRQVDPSFDRAFFESLTDSFNR